MIFLRFIKCPFYVFIHLFLHFSSFKSPCLILLVFFNKFVFRHNKLSFMWFNKCLLLFKFLLEGFNLILRICFYFRELSRNVFP
ncbi:unnamed protein product [Moneuplotes crassus]|uniref:Uncharacterized protein n=1 Tax=Euplotes crassus TaxID=5936 RepID=A0AAD1XYV7_EUPCR|nr:unnamed protein product [Moneuplotes crassus]